MNSTIILQQIIKKHLNQKYSFRKHDIGVGWVGKKVSTGDTSWKILILVYISIC